MSLLKSLTLIQFKNHIYLQQHFNSNIIAIVGKNGVGKTNILDAIYYLCYGKSYFSKSDKMLTSFNHLGFSLVGNFEKKGNLHQTKIILRPEGKKEIAVDDEILSKNSALLGKNSAVIIAPDDISIINEGSEGRRKYIDTILCQIDDTYLINLIQYNKVLIQRNALLKQLNEQKTFTSELLTIYNNQLVQFGKIIYEKRAVHIPKICEITLNFYKKIALSNDSITIDYQSQITNNSYLSLLENNIQKDIYASRTNIGIHKDDLQINLHNEAFKYMASQGQKKSLLLALKLTELNYLQQYLSDAPILLLDDIAEKLDAARLALLFNYITTQTTSMVIITDTHKQRIESLLAPNNNTFVWEIE
jgi:DNA replication and repair protein RecF